MSRICQAWNNEIKSSSPELWQNMLRRRRWPITDDRHNDIESLRNQLSSYFLLHFGIVLNMEAVLDTLSALPGSGKTAFADETKMVYHSFSTQQTAPQVPNGCINDET
jgi:hypothetical protein